MQKSECINILLIKCMDEKATIEGKLQASSVSAKIFNDDKFYRFCQNELLGYKKENQLPSYRKFKITNVLMKQENFFGANVCIAKKDGITETDFDYRAPIAFAESFLKTNSGDYITSPAPSQPIYINSKEYYDSRIKRSYYINLLNEVNNKILNWAKKQNLLLDNPAMDQPNYFVNICGDVTNSSIAAVQQIASNNVINKEMSLDQIQSFVKLIEDDFEKRTLDPQSSLIAQIDELKKKIDEKDEFSALTLLSNLVQGAVSSGIWSVGSGLAEQFSHLIM